MATTKPRKGSYAEQMREHLECDPASTVVLTVDLQRDYLDPKVASSPVLEEEAKRVVSNSADLLDFARSRHIPVVHAYSIRRPVEAEHGFEYGGLAYIRAGRKAGLSQNPQVDVKRTPDRLAGSPQSEVPARLVEPTDIHITTKKTLDSYQYSDLDVVLGRVLQPETVVLIGVNTDTCVYSTAFSTANRGYKPVVVEECVASMRGIDRHEMALELMSGSIAWVVGLADVKKALDG